MRFIYTFLRILFFYFVFVALIRLLLFFFRYFFSWRRKAHSYNRKKTGKSRKTKEENIVDAEYEEVE